MLVLDFINVGEGDATLVRQVEHGETLFSMLIDCGHDELVRPSDLSKRIYAGDFLRQNNITSLDLLVLTHYHRDHVGGIGRVLAQCHVKEAFATYFPPDTHDPLDPEADNGLPKGARNVVRWLDAFNCGWQAWKHKVDTITTFSGVAIEPRQPTPDLTISIIPSERGFYPRQTQLYDAVFSGERDPYQLMQWAKSLNPSSLRIRLSYHGKDVVIGGDLYGVMWDANTTAPCHILKVPHHGSVSSVTRKMLSQLQPEICVLSVSSTRHDEKPHPFACSLIQQYCQHIHCTDAVALEGYLTPVYHESVHFELE
ncbi:MBL fold metallo-hydrolase [Bengtsoniella intestinalis]|uniref:ComEC/Rec2 family competence protein n=1 Tax=Bengtsoniella intestinalis TaxID=3073143 RepID=UPI00391F746A